MAADGEHAVAAASGHPASDTESAPEGVATPGAASVNEGLRPPSERQRRQVARLQVLFEHVHEERMRDVPICNEALRVEAVGFGDWQGRALGVLITPWFMNLVLLPGEDDDWSGLRVGEKVEHVFPAGAVEFIVGREDELVHQACSLFSPVFEFAEQETARQAALAALQALLQQREEALEAEEWQRHQEEEEARRRAAEEAARQEADRAAEEQAQAAADPATVEASDAAARQGAVRPEKPPLQREVSRRALFRGLLGGDAGKGGKGT